MESSLADMAAVGKLLDEHGPKLLAMLRRRLDPALNTRIDAEDLLNEVFLEAHRKWAGFKEQAALTPYAWLYRIALDRLIEAWRKHTRACRSPKRELPWPDGSSIQLGLGLVGPETSPSAAVVREELQEQMRQVLALLKASDREVLWMRYRDELSFKEAAAVLGISESAATLRCLRALKRLKDLWLQLHPESSV